MNTNYQKGKQDVRDIKNKAEETYEDLSNKGQQYYGRAQGATDQTKQEGEGLWQKTKNVATDVKDSVVEGASSVYESARDLVTGTATDQKNDQITQTEVKKEIIREPNKDIVGRDLDKNQNSNKNRC